MAFSVERCTAEGPRIAHKYVVDHGRAVWLQRVSTYIQQVGHDAYQLHWGNRMFLLESHLGVLDSDHGEIRVDSFGFSYLGAKAGLVSDPFIDDEDRQDVAKLAAEALITYGLSYRGFRDPPGFWRVHIDGRAYASSDFTVEG